jgi:hypothetical protein
MRIEAHVNRSSQCDDDSAEMDDYIPSSAFLLLWGDESLDDMADDVFWV